MTAFQNYKEPSISLSHSHTDAGTHVACSIGMHSSLSLAFSILRSTTVNIIAYSKRYFADTIFFLIQWKNNNVNTGGGFVVVFSYWETILPG